MRTTGTAMSVYINRHRKGDGTDGIFIHHMVAMDKQRDDK